MGAVIFDLDGTLIDSMYMWDRLAYEFLQSIGYQPCPEIYKELRNMDLVESSSYLKLKYRLEMDRIDIENSMKDLIRDYYENRFDLKPGARDFLDRLEDAGIDMCIGTTTDSELVDPLLDRLGIAGYFKFIETEASLGISKSDRRFYLEVLEKLGARKEDTWVFEDALYAIESAKSAGFKLVAVRDESNRDLLGQIRKKSDFLIGDFREMEVDLLWKNF